MQQRFSQFPFLFASRLKSRYYRPIYGVVLAAVLLFTVYSTKEVATFLEPLLSKGSINQSKNISQTRSPASQLRKNEAPALATITTPVYEAKLYWAVPFIPRNAAMGLIQADSGHQFILLDIAVRNITTDKHVDMGTILLTTTVRDEKGREYFSDALVIAAFNLEFPYPQHHTQYSAMKGILPPGASHRTIAFGFEAPADAKHFVLSMENGTNCNVNKLYEASFTIS
jgi:hypothetical protein